MLNTEHEAVEAFRLFKDAFNNESEVTSNVEMLLLSGCRVRGSIEAQKIGWYVVHFDTFWSFFSILFFFFFFLKTQHFLKWNVLVWYQLESCLYQSHKSQQEILRLLSPSMPHNKFWALLWLYFLCKWGQTTHPESCVSLFWCLRKWIQSTGAQQNCTDPFSDCEAGVAVCESSENMQLVSGRCWKNLCPRLEEGLGRLMSFCFQLLEPDRSVSSSWFYFWMQLVFSQVVNCSHLTAVTLHSHQIKPVLPFIWMGVVRLDCMSGNRSGRSWTRIDFCWNTTLQWRTLLFIW